MADLQSNGDERDSFGGVCDRPFSSVSLRRSYSILRGGLRQRGGRAFGGKDAPRSFNLPLSWYAGFDVSLV